MSALRDVKDSKDSKDRPWRPCCPFGPFPSEDPAMSDRFIDKRSRTHDQMIQAARSGKQNIIEGSMASATSKETEIKLTRWHARVSKSCWPTIAISCVSA